MSRVRVRDVPTATQLLDIIRAVMRHMSVAEPGDARIAL